MSYGSLEGSDDNAPLAEINMVPLIDVMLVLLVIFLVTAPMLTHAVKLELPRAASSPNTSKPDMVQLSYTAGLANAAQDYPELIDVVKKKAVLSVLADSFVPQSGSISADGLSQSMSMDLGKYSEAIDEIIHGPKGSNGGLMTKIHGIRGMVF